MELIVKKIIKTEVDDEEGFVKYLTTLESKEKEIVAMVKENDRCSFTRNEIWTLKQTQKQEKL